MNELWAALLGALVGGVASALTAAWQTGRVLKHETRMARSAAEEARRAERHQSQRQAALRMLDVLADYTTPPSRLRRDTSWFGGPMTEAEHAALDRRIADIGRMDASAALTLYGDERDRWHQLYRLALWVHRPGAGEQNLQRDIGDVLAYSEYVRRTLVAVVDDLPIPMHAAPPDPQRADQRVWGWKPPEDAAEPDLTDWISSRSRPGLVTRAMQANESPEAARGRREAPPGAAP